MARILRRIVFAGLIIAAGLAASRLLAAPPTNRAGLQGTISDLATDRPLAGARVRAGDQEAITDARGQFRLAVPAGTYDVRAEAPGYVGMTRCLLAVTDGQEAALDLQMIPEAPDDEQSAVIERKLIQTAEQSAAGQVGAAASQGLAASGVTVVPGSIRVLMPDGSVATMDLDEYLKGVVPREMSPAWPAEALRAQAVAARSYAITGSGHADAGADVCTTTHCQVWSPIHYDTTDQAVEATSGVTARYEGNVIRAFFHAHCDGHTRDSEAVWGGQVAYLRGVSCPCGFTSLYGHGVGMCQYGARALALQGFDHVAILQHYYTGVEVSGPQRISLGRPLLSPLTGDQGTLFSFAVTYEGGEDVAPAVANVVIDGRAHALTLAPNREADGREYRLETYLPAGEHSFYYYVADGRGQATRLPASGTFSGPKVASTGSPITSTTESGVVGRDLTFSTPADWADGSFEGVQVGSQGDGALVLAEGASSGTYTSPVLTAPLSFVALGASWHAAVPGDAALDLQVRTGLSTAAWGPWTPLVQDDEPSDGARVHSPLHFGEGRLIQYRATLRAGSFGVRPVLENLTFVLIDSRPGPQARALAAAGSVSAQAAAMPTVITRQQWGADEAWMTSPPQYRPVIASIVHHTATRDGDVDPAAIVRAIYYYHAITLEWGDIGYNYLVDIHGNVYEGRYGGSGVVGHHAGAYNWGSVGVSLIGNFQEAEVPAAMRDSLINVLAAKCAEHSIDPLGERYFIDQVLPSIMGHRDVSYTVCPGNYAYALLPQIRSEVSARLAQERSEAQVILVYIAPAGVDLAKPPQARIAAPAQGAVVRGIVEVTGVTNVPVESMSLYADGIFLGTQGSARSTWRWNTLTVPDGAHTLRVVAQNASGTGEATVSVTVDNTPPSGTVSVPAWSTSTLVPVTISSPDAVAVQFSNGWIWEGEDLRHQEGTGARVADPEALNGAAWKGTAGSSVRGYWYGPYVLDLPPWRNYQVYFRLKSPRTWGTTPLAVIDASDNQGTRVYQSRVISGQDVPTGGYHEYVLDVAYQSTEPTYHGVENGLEFRTWYESIADLSLDRVAVFSAPQNLPASPWEVRAEGAQSVTVRLLDRAGNFLDVPVTVHVDATAPEALEVTPGAALVRDAVSGLDTRTAEWSASPTSDGPFSAWKAISLTAPVGTTAAVRIQAPAGTSGYVRLRVRDVAGNELVLPTY